MQILPSPTTGSFPGHTFNWKSNSNHHHNQQSVKQEQRNFSDFSFQTQKGPPTSSATSFQSQVPTVSSWFVCFFFFSIYLSNSQCFSHDLTFFQMIRKTKHGVSKKQPSKWNPNSLRCRVFPLRFQQFRTILKVGFNQIITNHRSLLESRDDPKTGTIGENMGRSKWKEAKTREAITSVHSQIAQLRRKLRGL